MNRKFVETFECPKCCGTFRLAALTPAKDDNEEITAGRLVCAGCATTVPIVRSLPRFVPSESYASSFGFQWNRFDRLQLDSHMQNDLSRERFYATTGWPTSLAGQRILEAGCGMGRFTQLALETGAEVISFDLSTAAEAAWRNNAGAKKLCVLQGSIYEIPLRKKSFDKIFCMGVLQHCPDVAGAFRSLVPFLKPQGEIVIDVYEKARYPKLKYIARPVLKFLSVEQIYTLLQWTIPPAFELKKAISHIPAIGPPLARLIPIGPISHAPRLNYTDEQLKK